MGNTLWANGGAQGPAGPAGPTGPTGPAGGASLMTVPLTFGLSRGAAGPVADYDYYLRIGGAGLPGGAGGVTLNGCLYTIPLGAALTVVDMLVQADTAPTGQSQFFDLVLTTAGVDAIIGSCELVATEVSTQLSVGVVIPTSGSSQQLAMTWRQAAGGVSATNALATVRYQLN